MASGSSASEPRRILVALPNWVGDVVLATPALAALRARFASAEIHYLLRRPLEELVDGCGWHDGVTYWPERRRGLGGLLGLARALGALRFDVALLFPNSLRSALIAWLARVPRRVGYARDGRGLLLTDRLKPLRRGGAFVPTPITPYYSEIARRIGCPVADERLRLGVSEAQDAGGARVLRQHGLDGGEPFAALNPGAAFGVAKCWPAERFAELADLIADELSLRCVLVGSPPEADLLTGIASRAKSRPTPLLNPGTTLGTLKGVLRRARLLVCNDTGPRHYGNALRVPTVTIFGPTHQEWTRTSVESEARIQKVVDCGPCQLPQCPLDHRCMTEISPREALEAARALLVASDDRGAARRGLLPLARN